MTEKIMVPETKLIRSILEGSTLYQIPDFQRDYSWYEVQQTDFLKDLLSNLGKQYFFGTIIVVKSERASENAVYSLIDGQQRLTTFVIFLQAIRDLIVDARTELNPKASKATSYDDLLVKKVSDVVTGNTYQKSVLVNNKLNPILPSKILKIGEFGDSVEPETSEQKLIFESYERFKDKLSLINLPSTLESSRARPNQYVTEYLSLEDKSIPKYIEFLDDLADQLVGRSSMVVITSDSQAFAQTIFKNLNSRGIPLNSIDLMKNDLLDVLNYKDQAGVVENIWANILRITNVPIERTSRTEWTKPEDFFSRYWNLSTKMSKKAAETRKMYEYFETNIDSSSESYKKLLDDFQYTANLYNQFFTVHKKSEFMKVPNYFARDGHFETLTYITFLRSYQQERTLILSLFIAREKKMLSDSKFKNLLRAATYFRILWQIGGGKSNRLAFFDKTARDLNSATLEQSSDNIQKSLKEYKARLISHLNGKDPGDISVDDITKRIVSFKYTHNPRDTNQLVKHVLTMFELSKKDSKPMNNEFEKIYSAQVEHIIPHSQNVDILPNLSPISEIDEKKIDMKTKQISNSEGKPIAAGFLEKKDVYLQSSFMLLKQLGKQESFEKKDLENRQIEMAESIFQYALKKISEI
ncbi:DUF262 domain-containing protein [Leuconostoc suionicum]|uniref:DUF262 domain-containing protein n=1 Tax=Leuconostoc suionicum TaxID=1511761 RepID=UPI00300DAC00